MNSSADKCAAPIANDELVNAERPSAGPLQGLRVVELGTLIAAPFASRLLAEFGAEVIKVESPDGGDPLRSWRKLHKGTSLWWYLQSRNKKSVTINLRSPDGQAIVRRLVAGADVVIENFRPGTLERWGLGWDQLSAINPNLVMVRISGFGQTGPYRDQPGFGAIGEALGGIRFTTGAADQPPPRMGVSLGDSLASLHAVIGALMCLLHVKSGNGKGQVVDVSLVESVFNVMESIIPEYDLLGEVRMRTGGALAGIVPSNTYGTGDGKWVVIAGNGDSIFKRLMNGIGRPDFASDPRFQTNEGRVAFAALIDDEISEWTGQRRLDVVIETLRRCEVPCSPIYSVADIVKDPHYRARNMLLPMRLADGTETKMPGIVPKLSETPGQVNWIGPALGEHTEVVLRDAGFDADTIKRFREVGAI